jgi:transcriptional regulator with XRE-family HTH domain
MDTKQLIGKRIETLRKQKSLSQLKFSYEAEMERTYLNHIEKGRKNISVNTLQKITNALNISLKDFFDSTEFSKL